MSKAKVHMWLVMHSSLILLTLIHYPLKIMPIILTSLLLIYQCSHQFQVTSMSTCRGWTFQHCRYTVPKERDPWCGFKVLALQLYLIVGQSWAPRAISSSVVSRLIHFSYLQAPNTESNGLIPSAVELSHVDTATFLPCWNLLLTSLP